MKIRQTEEERRRRKNERNERWRDKNREKIKQQARDRYAKNRDKIRELAREHRKKNKKQENEYQRAWRDKNRGRLKEQHRQRKYGLSQEEFYSMLAGQGGVCAICGSSEWGPVGPAIDHDHETNMVRGILCHHCNILLGCSRDNKKILLSAIDYLESNG
jgi:hypothetical protein